MWTDEELGRIGNADELRIAPLRRDGTPRTPVTIWVVRHGADLYVRSYRGDGAAWYRGTQVRHEGHIQAAGVDRDVTFEAETDPGVNDEIDTAYRAKYGHYSGTYVDPMVAEPARATTLRLVPR
jgi:hypothetical protein